MSKLPSSSGPYRPAHYNTQSSSNRPYNTRSFTTRDGKGKPSVVDPEFDESPPGLTRSKIAGKDDSLHGGEPLGSTSSAITSPDHTKNLPSFTQSNPTTPTNIKNEQKLETTIKTNPSPTYAPFYKQYEQYYNPQPHNTNAKLDFENSIIFHKFLNEWIASKQFDQIVKIAISEELKESEEKLGKQMMELKVENETLTISIL